MKISKVEKYVGFPVPDCRVTKPFKTMKHAVLHRVFNSFNADHKGDAEKEKH